jgi:predicted negative regulator of RcsB-dependent stress response
MRALLAIAIVLGSATAAHAQLKLPEASPAATTEQTIGITEVKVVYHRPAVNGRTIWGQLVPYNEPWRCGANENTTVTFSSDVKVGGKPLKAGTYGLHMIPTQKEWTIAFSNMTTAWGSFTYDQKEDALRITVTPKTEATSEERLSYGFDDVAETKGTLVMRWEKLAVPIAIEVETPKVVMASVRGELRGLAGFRHETLTQAARYWLRNGGNLDEALKFIDTAIQRGGQFQAHTVKAQILEKKGNAAGASEERNKAQAVATENDLNQQAFALVNDKKIDEAVKLLVAATQRFPDAWNLQDSLGEVLALKGDKTAALAAYNKALSLTKDPTQKKRIEGAIAKLK